MASAKLSEADASGIWREISKYGKKLFDKGYMVSHSGNISVRCGTRCT
jgi:ribulose-5-phosphate 4-epimerase/fuculose-1-phosphate aldolase